MPRRSKGFFLTHVDDGSGRCAHDFEDWPCAVARGEPDAPGISLQEWEMEEIARRRERIAETNRRKMEDTMAAARAVGLSEVVENLERIFQYRSVTNLLPSVVDLTWDEFSWLVRAAHQKGIRHPFADDSDGVLP